MWMLGVVRIDLIPNRRYTSVKLELSPVKFSSGISTCINNQQLRARHLWNIMAAVRGPSGIVAHCQDVTVPSTTGGNGPNISIPLWWKVPAEFV